ncbi:MAG TPA: triose-phosphate isomerase [Candidatus Saccharimonadales bacterium]|jgi:triosephosphate isomerase|nr:triose-phosphate isomerase [Candidatus Saccharimonadales bacterium]
MRKKLIVANWKMYKSPGEVQEFVRTFVPHVQGHSRADIAICPPFTCLAALAEALRGTAILIGAQDVFWENEGAYTGEISAPMLVDAGCSYVIIGHSERRQYFGETDDTVHRKLKAALRAGLRPIVCVGEVLQEREANLTGAVLERQCNIAFRGIGGPEVAPLIVAYEPVWAIGTGKTATPEMAAEAHQIVRAQAEKAFGTATAQAMRIIYGGSVKHTNAKDLMSHPEIDGALVGGASLDAGSFAATVKY